MMIVNTRMMMLCLMLLLFHLTISASYSSLPLEVNPPDQDLDWDPFNIDYYKRNHDLRAWLVKRAFNINYFLSQVSWGL